jgi:uncharacterized protein (DUF924 family)
MHQDVIRFWFEEIPPKMWWSSDPAFDEQIRSRFRGTHQQAARGELHEWRSEPLGRLAEIIVLDQFSRNMFRGTPQAFAQDPMALVLSQEAVRLGLHAMLPPAQTSFLLMPFSHSESPQIHVLAERLFREFTPGTNYDYELRHKAIIDRFGRYPHRNAILGRSSSAEEIQFLQQPGSSF